MNPHIAAQGTTPEVVPGPDYCMTVQEAAEELELSEGTVQLYCRTGRLDAIQSDRGRKPWLISAESVAMVATMPPTIGQPNAMYCPDCAEFFLLEDGRACPRCGKQPKGYEPVRIGKEDLVA